MTKEQAIADLKELQNLRDLEAAHSQADEVLCNLLAFLGYADVVAEYEKLERWCA